MELRNNTPGDGNTTPTGSNKIKHHTDKIAKKNKQPWEPARHRVRACKEVRAEAVFRYHEDFSKKTM